MATTIGARLVALAVTLGCATGGTIAQAADLAPPPQKQYVPPRVEYQAPPPAPPVQRVDRCAWVEVRMHNWNAPAVFRVTAVGGRIHNGYGQTKAVLSAGGTRLCIPREMFVADAIEICIGDSSRDRSNSRVIHGQLMADARAHIERGGVMNPGNPMNFRYNGPTMRGPSRPHMYRRPVGYGYPYSYSSPMSSVATFATGVMVGRAIH